MVTTFGPRFTGENALGKVDDRRFSCGCLLDCLDDDTGRLWSPGRPGHIPRMMIKEALRDPMSHQNFQGLGPLGVSP